MKKNLILIFFLLPFSPFASAQLPTSAQAEIENILSALGSSACEFNRNGNWYSASDAQAHLRKKYEYLLKKKLISSTEEFITKGATESSMSSQPYQVRCSNAAMVPSSVWLTNQLQVLRKK